MTEAWSTQIADRYGCRLSSALQDWFDSGIWQSQGQGEFRQPIDPAALLEQAPEEIWPGMMGCDCLPILSNTVGDWLCVRIDRNNVAAEIIHWYHGGGDWIPWGKQLAEAIAFDAIADRFPSQHRRHAVPAESPRLTSDNAGAVTDPIARWAFEHLPADIVKAIESPMQSEATAEAFLQHEVAAIATRCELSISALLESEPGARGAAWAAAAMHASPVTDLSPELAWAWDTIGHDAERRGDLKSAREYYLQAVECSAFTDQSIRLMTHAADDRAAKFAVARLLELDPSLVRSTPYLGMLCDQDERTRRQAVYQYWLAKGQSHLDNADPSSAYNCFVAAGWDIGATPIETYGSILDQVALAAGASNQTARAEVAKTHRRCLNARFGK
jgi:hypothetical protein